MHTPRRTRKETIIMRIQPIESPRNPVLRLLNWATTRQLGKPITPAKVIFTRLPRAIAAQLGIYFGLAAKDGLDMSLKLLLQNPGATMTGCSFCVDIGRAAATYRGLTFEKFDAVASYRTSPLFTPAERAALAYVEEATQHKRVSDETFAELRKHFTDEQIVAITWLNAVENYFNLLNAPLGIESDGLCAIAERRTGRRATASQRTAA
jgi:alkylhydroperoxidase family enzyme